MKIDWSTERTNTINAVADCGKLMGSLSIWPQSENAVDVTGATTALSVSENFRRKGIGVEMYKFLMQEMPDLNLLARIRPDNVASVALHEKLGFRRMSDWDDIPEWASGLEESQTKYPSAYMVKNAPHGDILEL